DNNDVDPRVSFCPHLCEIDIFGALDSFRGEFKRPRHDERDWKSNDNCEHDQSEGPIRNFKDRENLCRDLDQQPADDRVGDGNLVNISSPQLGEEVTRRHTFTCYGPTCSLRASSCWKAGSLRIGSQTGSIFRRAMETVSPAGMASSRRRIVMASDAAPVRASTSARPAKLELPRSASLSGGSKSTACRASLRASASRLSA